jgi:alkaline phosphatase
MEGMGKTVLVVGAMASALLLASMAAVLTEAPGAGQRRTVTLVGAGDIAGCYFKADRKTARLVGKIGGTVFTLGDNAYPDGTRQQFRDCYDPTWGNYKKRTRPTAGNHDYNTAGAKPYFNYFRWRAGRPTGYYSYDRGSWHIVVLNSNCKEVGGCGKRSAQGRWLRRDLAQNPTKCTLAYFHHPLFASGTPTATSASPVSPPAAHVLRQGASASSSWGRVVLRAILNRDRTNLGCRPRRSAHPVC